MDKHNNSSSFAWIYGVVLVLALGILGIGIALAVQGQGWVMLAAGCVSLIGALIVLPLERGIAAARNAQAKQRDELLLPLLDRVQQISVLLTLISEQQLLSDRAKLVAFREKDRDALRRAIREEMGRQDWEAAMVLAADMEKEFGYKQEADNFRDEINHLRGEQSRKQIAEVVTVIERHCHGEKWGEAIREAERLNERFPGHEMVVNLAKDIEVKRQAFKNELLNNWQEAVNRKDVDGSIEILKHLDSYLTSAEAESMKETANSVFKAKVENLRVQFSLAVQDHKWAEAVRIGEVIMRDFPNVRAAQEIREKMDALRVRAAAPAGVV